MQLVLSENEQHGLVNLGKADVAAGKVSAQQFVVRINPNDHPTRWWCEGKAPVGRKAPSTPWGQTCSLVLKLVIKAKSDKLTFVVATRKYQPVAC